MIIFGFVYLYILVGKSLFVGLGFTLVFMLLNLIIVSLNLKNNKEFLKVSGQRIKKFSEVFTNIIYVKANNFENHYFNEVNKLRKEEMRWNKRYFYLSAIEVSGLYMTSTVLYISTFVTYIYLGNVPTVSMIFTFMSIYENI